MNWGELKTAVVVEIGEGLTTSDADNETVSRMYVSANAGLQRLASAGYIKKTIEFDVQSVLGINLLGDNFETYAGNQTFRASGALAYYFEMAGSGTVTITTDSETTTITNTSAGYTAYRGNITGSGVTEIKFEGTIISERNICLYKTSFDTVPDYKKEVIINLKDKVSDIFTADISKALFFDGTWKDANLRDLPDNKVIVDMTESGTYRIPYSAYPQTLTSSTTDNAEIVCDADGLVLLVYYIAYHLYKGDDITLATQWHNDFEEGIGAGRTTNDVATVVSDYGTI
jgi:hypothetical protein